MGARLCIPRLLAITPIQADATALESVLPALRGIVDAVLLRWPTLTARRQLELAIALAELPERPVLLMSDRMDIALAAKVEGVQLRERGIAPERARAHAVGLLLGVSRHDAHGVAASAGADFIVLSPVHPTRSKPGSPGLGEAGLAELIRESPRPVLALGGVEPEHVSGTLEAGAHGVAVLSGILGSARPVEQARRYRRALDNALARQQGG